MNEINHRALGRALTRAANASVEDVLAGRIECPPTAMRRIALTGAPGSGKSTLAGALARHRLTVDPDLHIGVLAVDPSSRYSGGAILGDRIRMDSAGTDPRLFIRSLASRKTGEGLADNMAVVLDVLGSFGFGEAITETVGAGQIDCAVRDLADTVVLVLNPESGDAVQAMKAGIMETADIYVVNKADLPGAANAVAALRSGVGSGRNVGWDPPILETTASDPDSAARLSDAIDAHLDWRAANLDHEAVYLERRNYALLALAHRKCREVLDGAGETQDLLAELGAAFHSLAELAGGRQR